MKKLLVLFLAAMMALSFFGCGSQVATTDVATSTDKTAGADEKPTILFLSHIIGHPVYVRIEEAFQEAADEYGFEAIYGGPPMCNLTR